MERVVVLCFVEMEVQPDLCYDTVQGKILGPYSSVQVVIVRGLTGKWKQPLYYEFDKPIDKDLLLNIVENFEMIGFQVGIKKKNLPKIIEYGNLINLLPIQNKDWLSSISRGFLMEQADKWLEIVFKMEENLKKKSTVMI